MSLARRRHDAARMKARARKIYDYDTKAKLANHLAVCSCWMCGNPRRHLGEVTMQERKAPKAWDWESCAHIRQDH
ncbi:MAG: hypothetical protein Q4G24_15520 [Paracoccus sp. (in: a-proteobacteria)]|uniref:hypothetical protein n=1 Tax=Paracoccus sp. TaxID=267 RepID=UPI0026DF006A|nr:hypothetical protein [Paracoccus sp. (in: a-proteobacteria)]MDO5622857.1 hypothetical protein [Paracoccus sp. (in: a-proteobacteria)]